MSESIVVSDRGQITIPAKLRQSLDLVEGTRLVVTDMGGFLTMYPMNSNANNVKSLFSSIKPKPGKSADPDIAINSAKIIKSKNATK